MDYDTDGSLSGKGAHRARRRDTVEEHTAQPLGDLMHRAGRHMREGAMLEHQVRATTEAVRPVTEGEDAEC